MYTGKPSKYSVDGDDWQSRLYIPSGMEGLTAFRGPGSRQLRDAEKRAERRRQLEERSAKLLFSPLSVPSTGLGFPPILPGSIPHSSQIDLLSQVSPAATGIRSCNTSRIGTDGPRIDFIGGEAAFGPKLSSPPSYTEWFTEPTQAYTGDHSQTALTTRCLCPEPLSSIDTGDHNFPPNNVDMSTFTSLPSISKCHGVEVPARSQSSAYKERDDQQVTHYDYDLRQLRNWPDFDKMQYDPHCNDQEGVTTSDECLKGAYDFDFDS